MRVRTQLCEAEVLSGADNDLRLRYLELRKRMLKGLPSILAFDPGALRSIVVFLLRSLPCPWMRECETHLQKILI